MPPKDKYTDPELRDQVKEEIKQSDKGGAPGQWSARKAQFMAQEYKKRGGTYTTDKSEQDESQKNLSKWTEEEWQTKEGSGHAEKEDGTQKRYLPKKAWEKMTEEEKEATDQKKQEESKEGKQFVGNTSKAKKKREEANQEESEQYEQKKAKEKQQNGTADEEEEEKVEEKEEEVEDDDEGDDAAAADDDSEEEYHDAEESASDEDAGEEEAEPEDDEAQEHDGQEEGTGEKQASAGQKRKNQQQSSGSSKKQKPNNNSKGGNAPAGKVGSKHMDASEPAPRGSADRLPKKGQQVTWKALPGYVEGSVEEILTQFKNVDGKSVKASKEDPKIVLKSNSSGKICVHKPDACFYE